MSKDKDWNDIVKFYRELNDVHGWNMQPMVRLVEEITSSRYAQGIFAVTSHATLCISQNQNTDLKGNLLLIDFFENHFTFAYREEYFTGKKWIKECAAENGFATFEYVMAKLKWFLN